MGALSLNAEVRTEKGKNSIYRLRQRGFIPAVLYSHGDTEVIQIKKQDILNLFKGRISESVLIELNITNKKEDSDHQVFIKDYQLDPVTDDLMHLDFFKITKGEKINTKVPVITVGRSEGENMGGILEVVTRELEIECLPSEMLEKIEIDVTNLVIGDLISIKDIEIVGSQKFTDDGNRVVITVLAPHKVEEEEVEGEEVEGEEVEGEEVEGEEVEGEDAKGKDAKGKDAKGEEKKKK